MKEKILEEIKKALKNGKNFIEEVWNKLGISLHESNGELHIGNGLNKTYDNDKTICIQNPVITKQDLKNYGIDPNKVFKD